MLFPLWVNDFPAKIFLGRKERRWGGWGDDGRGGVKGVFRAGVLSLQLRLTTPPPPTSTILKRTSC